MNTYQFTLIIYGSITLFAGLLILALCLAARRADKCLTRKQRGRFLNEQGTANKVSASQAESALLPSRQS